MTSIEVHDSRRLTGPNLLQDGPGPTLDATVPSEVDREQLVASWREHVQTLLGALGQPAAVTAHRLWDGGLSLAFDAPIDRLYTMCELNEAAFDLAVADVTGSTAPIADVEHLREELAAERATSWTALLEAAAARGVDLLWDDDEFSVGLGQFATTWPVDSLPAVEDVRWSAAGHVPVVLVTGTNGKSTTVRLTASILSTAGVAAGSTSTDGIRIGDAIVETGDFSGPGGARTVLRHHGVETAVLEVARGGLLRRGLPLPHADIAVVTNIADDHLGEYGIETVEDLAQAKLVVAKAIRPDGLLILNADDPLLVAAAPAGIPIGWFTLDPSSEVLADHVALGGTGWTIVDGVIVERRESRETPIVRIDQVPITYGGAARHNVANTLAAVAIARRLSVPRDAIVEGLRAFKGDADDNPGRANRFTADGVEIIVDFAHNPAGMRAITEMAARLPAERRLVMFGQAGDRSDEAIRSLARAVWATDPDHVIAMDVPNYLRGREPMEVPELIANELRAAGASAGEVNLVSTPVEGVEAALAWAKPGDLLLLMVLEMRDEAIARITAAAS